VKKDTIEHAQKVVLEFKCMIPLSSSCRVLTLGWSKASDFNNDRKHEGHEEMRI